MTGPAFVHLAPAENWRGLRYVQRQSLPDRQERFEVVLLPGMGSTLRHWSAVAPLLPTGCRVIAVDAPTLRGDLGRGVDSLEGASQQLLSLFAHLGARRVVLVGHSLGGPLALSVAAAAGNSVVHVILVSAILHSLGEMILQPQRALCDLSQATAFVGQLAGAAVPTPRSLRNRMLGTAVGRRLLRYYIHDPGRVDVRLLREVMSDSRPLGLTGTIALLRAARSRPLAGLAHLNDKPVSLMWGENDQLLTRRDILWANRAFNPVRAVQLTNCGHWPAVEQPRAVAQLIGDTCLQG